MWKRMRAQQLKRERDYARSRKNHDAPRSWRSARRAEKEYEKKVEEWEKVRRSSTGEVNVSDVRNHLPATAAGEQLTLEERERLLKMEDRLHERVLAGTRRSRRSARPCASRALASRAGPPSHLLLPRPDRVQRLPGARIGRPRK